MFEKLLSGFYKWIQGEGKTANPVDVVSKKLNIPRWWVEAIAIEYKDCREFAQEKDIWKFKFEKVNSSDLENAVKENHVILHDCIYHNIHPAVFQSRMIFRMVSSIPAPLSAEMEDIVPEGLVSPLYIPLQTNSIDTWDPKLSFSSHCQVFDDGHLYQWKIAEFVHVDGMNYGKFTSELLDLEQLDVMQQELQTLRNPIIKSGHRDHKEFKEKVEDYYLRLDNTRRPILKQLLAIHKQKLQTYSAFPKILPYNPPILSHFEQFTVRENDYYTELHVEPIFYRGCYYHARKAEELIVNIKNENDFVHSLDEIYQERATAIVLAASCFEAFINGLGFDNYPDKWKKIERSNLERKCIEYYSLSGKDPSLFDSDKEPFKKLMTLFEYRNNLVHFKRLYKKSEEINHKYITDTENQLPREFVRDLPENLRKCIIEICNVKSTPIPEWVTPHSNLGWMK